MTRMPAQHNQYGLSRHSASIHSTEQAHQNPIQNP